METRANFVLIGAFALAGFFGILAFFLWFARLELDRQFAYYDIDFESVSGLSDASDVRFAGLPVGQVVDVRLSPDRDGKVRVRIEVAADTPVRTDSIATIESQGVTGVAFVGISAGTPEAPLLAAVSKDAIPRIQAGKSVLQSLSQDAPEILSETLEVVKSLRELIGGENQRRVSNILDNVDNASAKFSQTLEDFSAVSKTVADFAREIDRFNSKLDGVTADVSSALAAVENSLASFDALSEDARRLLDQGVETLKTTDATMAEANRYVAESLAPATDQINRSVAEVQVRLTALADSADGLFATLGRTGETATARLDEARTTLAATDEMIARLTAAATSVETVASRLDGIARDQAGPLIDRMGVAVTDATEVIRRIGETANTDLPAIMADIRAATAKAGQVIDTVGTDLSTASARVNGLTESADATLESVRVTFARANDTLAAINGALETGDRAMAAAERAFDGADRVFSEDAARITESLRQTLAQLDSAISAVAKDIPAVTEDLRSASRSAQAAFAGLEEAVNASAPAINEFAVTAMPQYARLAVETRALIDNLDTLVEQIRRDPGRFFLNPRAPEFKR